MVSSGISFVFMVAGVSCKGGVSNDRGGWSQMMIFSNRGCHIFQTHKI